MGVENGLSSTASEELSASREQQQHERKIELISLLSKLMLKIIKYSFHTKDTLNLLLFADDSLAAEITFQDRSG